MGGDIKILISLKAAYMSVFMVVLLQISGCSSVPEASKRTSIPSWVQTPQGDTNIYIYGIGEGLNLEEAKKNGLRDIAGKIATNISSQSESKASDHDGSSSRYFRQKVNTFIKDTKLSSYETIKIVQNNDQFYVLIAMSRSAFIKENQSRLDEIDHEIEMQLAGMPNDNKLVQLVVYNKIVQLSIEAKDVIVLLRVTDSSFNETPYLNAYRSYQQKEKELSETTQFSIRSTASMKPLSIQIKKALQMNGFQIDTDSTPDSIIELVGAIKESEIFSTKNVSVKFDILVKANSDQLIKSSNYHLNGSSTTSFSIARDNAFSQFAVRLKNKSDIYQLLGMSK